MENQPTTSQNMNGPQNLRRRQLSYLEHVVRQLQITRTEIARAAGVSPSTISKFENDGDNMAQLGAATIDKIANYTGIPFDTWRGSQSPQAPEAEAEFVEEILLDGPIARAVQALKIGGNSIDIWKLKSSALDLAGYLPGDLLVVDVNADPVDGDIVCAQTFDRLGRSETIFRRYQKPFISAHSTNNKNYRPLIVDEDKVSIKGVVTATLRPRLSS